MFDYCADPSVLNNSAWLACYLTTAKHITLYWSVLIVFALLALAGPLALAMGLLGAVARRSGFIIFRWFGWLYTSMVRGIPDIIFFLFVPLALDQLFEYLRHRTLCPEETGSVWVGNDFVVCQAAKLPLGPSPEWVHDTYGFFLAVIAYTLVFGAFAANVIHGALNSVPKSQVETAKAYGMTQGQTFWRVLLPQMWVYALPGLSNIWMILIKATPLLFLLGIEDVVYWARELGASKTARFSDYPHPDWRVYYFGGLLIFYLLLTWASQLSLARISARLNKGQATLAGKGAAI